MKIKKILFPTDFSDISKHALDYAIMIAEKYQAVLDLVYVDEATYLMNPVNLDLQSDYSGLKEEIRKAVDDKMREWVRLFPKEIPVSVSIEMGKPHIEIVEAAKTRDSDLIIMGTHGRSDADYFLGSNAERVVRTATCPVLTIRQAGIRDRFTKVLFPVDFSELCRRVVPQVIGLAKEFGAELHLLHVSLTYTHETMGFAKEEFSKFLAGLDMTGVNFLTDVYGAFVENTGITEYAQKNDIDLITIGTHGRTGLKRFFMGSVTEEVVNTSLIPVLTLRSFKPVA